MGFALAVIISIAWLGGSYALINTLFSFPRNRRSGTLLWASRRVLQLITRLDQEIKSSGHALVARGRSMKFGNKESQNGN